MENLIVLDLEWVDLHNEHIIWYAYFIFFVVTLDQWFLRSCKTNVLKHTILYVQCVDLLILSPIQLDFSFYRW
jgi:hypothetical protein